MNEKAHEDIESDIEKKQNGSLTFTIRVNNGIIVDVNTIEYVDKKTITELEQEVIKEFITTYIDRSTD